MGIKKYEDIIAWHKVQDFTVEIYTNFKDNKDFSFKDQITRASVSFLTIWQKGLIEVQN